MSFRDVLVALAVPTLLVVGCAPVSIYALSADKGAGGAGGHNLGGSFESSYASSAGTGSFAAEAETGTATVSASAGTGTTSSGGAMSTGSAYRFLCGTSTLKSCVPGTDDDCSQGGDPGVGGGSTDATKYSCQLVLQGSSVVGKCGMAGPGGDGAPCQNVSYCAAGFGCAYTGTSVTPLCRQYCCDSLESCSPGTYCSKQTMAEGQPQIPVCIPVTHCDLLNDATCPAGDTCAIVRASGAVSCVQPGMGKDHDPCPCAAGYTCSWADSTCLKLCHTTGNMNECGSNAFCQGGTAPYPTGIGYCVSY